MSDSNIAIRKKRGRPRVGQTPVVSLRLIKSGNRTLMNGAAGSPTIYPVPTPSELCSAWDCPPPMKSASGMGAKRDRSRGIAGDLSLEPRTTAFPPGLQWGAENPREPSRRGVRYFREIANTANTQRNLFLLTTSSGTEQGSSHRAGAQPVRHQHTAWRPVSNLLARAEPAGSSVCCLRAGA